eukprot:CAMPEP_0198206924 /NCGR_PEP_ID=MMETSP1445-20131203/10438_1 /TAXON_ID=36898 /ORGANISM="Pyramimonas sp., Strain CCMP2087" /LENGTH=853 /DNA_ID=CAMNT_0043879791 /DNA_START=368 /DNA_END=2929 /DNA_ORIENTATION=+
MANLPMYDAPTSAPPKPKTIAVPEYDAPTYAPPKDQPKYHAPASAPPKDQLKFDAPKGPPPSGMKAPARQNMHTEGGDSGKEDVLQERQELLMKYRDADDIRGKGTYDKMKAFLQYDQFEVDIEGNDSKQEQVFEGLVPGEHVVITLDAFIRHKQRTKLFICCCCFFTLGLYLVYMFCFSMCRKRICASTRVTLGILSSGRIVYWHADKQGARRTIISTMDVDCQTYRRFFKMQDISMVQFKFKKMFDVFDENDSDEQDFSARPMGHLRLFMGKFPIVTTSAEDWVTTPSGKLQTAELQARAAPSSDFSPPEDCFVKYGDAILRVYDFINLVYDTLLMIRGIFELSVFNFVRFVFLVFRNILNAYRLALYGEIDPLDDVAAKDRCIDVYIHDDDEFTMGTTDGIYHKLVAFQKEMLRVKAFRPALERDPTLKKNEGYHWHRQMGEPSTLLKRVDQNTGADAGVLSGSWALGTTSVGVHEDEVPLAEGEYIIDAYGEQTKWTAADIGKALITFGLYYLLYLRRSITKKKAVILTNMRLIQVMKAGELRNRLPTYAQVVYELDLKWWSLEGAYAGLVHEHGLSMTGDIATKQGVLRTSLTQIKRSFCDANVLHDTVRRRFEDFHYAAASTIARPVLAEPTQWGLSESGRDARAGILPPTMLPLQPKMMESVLAQFSNENIFDMWTCGSWTSCCTCGFKPIILDGNILVSNYRYMATLRPHYNPWCFSSFLVPSQTYRLWADLDKHKKTLQGYSLQGTVKDHTLCCSMCAKCFCPARARAAKLSTVDFVLMAFNGRPVSLRRKNFEAGHEEEFFRGHMEDPEVKLLKHAMSATMAALGGPPERKAGPYKADLANVL